MTQRTHEYIPIHNTIAPGRPAFMRKAILDLTEKDKQFLDDLSKLTEGRLMVTKPSQHPGVQELVDAFLKDEPKDWFAVEGQQINEV